LLPERGEPGNDGGWGEDEDCSTDEDVGAACSKPKDAISSMKEGKDAIAARY